jgi:hypothetical protein
MISQNKKLLTYKSLIIDKSTFQGTSTYKLQGFVKNHFLILSTMLWYECSTDDKDTNKSLSKRFGDVVSAGGYICEGGGNIVRKEAQALQPYGFLADLNETNKCRQALEEGAMLSNPKNINDIRNSHVDSAKTYLDWYSIVAQEICQKKLDDVFVEVKQSKLNSQQRFERWTRIVDSLDIHKVAVRSKLSKSPEKYCLSGEWVTWHYIRMAVILAIEYEYHKGKPGDNQQERVEHDIEDMDYAFLLSRADGLLTGDEKLVKPLAKAAFPQKDVFSSIDEVPEEYMCNWS